MNRLKKFWIIFFPLFIASTASAGILGTIFSGLVTTVVINTGISLLRTAIPYDMPGALEFFSTCWTCQMFADIIAIMSGFVYKIYMSVGAVTVNLVLILTAVWFAWKLFSGFINAKIEEPWSITETFTHHMFKMFCVILLLMAPVPRLVSDIAIRPIFNVGLVINRAASSDVDDDFNNCLVATAAMDTSLNVNADSREAFSPRLRHEMACELLGVHKLTGVGLTLGWVLAQLSFDYEHAHKLLFGAFMPNIPLLFAGILLMAVFMMALIPIPMYFLEIFIKLSLDLVMLPLMLLAWLFKGWAISLDGAGKTIRGIIDDVINGALGLGLTGVFISFCIKILDKFFDSSTGIVTAIDLIKANNTDKLVDTVLNGDSGFVSMLLMGAFIAMFMSSIPALAKTLFNVEISQEFYNDAKNNVKKIWANGKKMWESLKK